MGTRPTSYLCPVVAVVAGGVGTVAVVTVVALAWNELRRLGPLQPVIPEDQPEDT